MYNKLFSKIVDSSIWLAPDPVRLVWITFLAIMDEDGMVQLPTVANVSHRARVDLAAAEEAVKVLESPEPSTATDDDDGRRIEKVPGGWLVLNAKKYRDMATREIARESNRLRVARHRAKKAGNADVTAGNGDATEASRPVMQSETDTDTDKGSPSESLGGARGRKTATRMPQDFALTPERREIAIREKIDPDRTFLAFKNYWLAKSGSDARKHDWDATWVNWCMREADGNGKRGTGRTERVSAAERVRRATGVKLG
jgi:hypothetical protein